MIRFLFPVILLSFLLSLMLSILPLPGVLLTLNPSWCLLTVLFWVYAHPKKVNVGLAGGVGLLLDSLTGSPLGLHVCAFVIVVFLFDLFYRRFHMFHILQQSLMIGILMLIYWVIVFIIGYLFTNMVLAASELLSVITSVFCWPLYCVLGQKFHLMRG